MQTQDTVRQDLVAKRSGSLDGNNFRFKTRDLFGKGEELIVGILLSLELSNFVVFLGQLVCRACFGVLVAAEKASKTVVEDSRTKDGSNDTSRKTGSTNAFRGVFISLLYTDILSSPQVGC